MDAEREISKPHRLLPEAFEDLEPFTDWALATEVERMAARESSTMEELRAFYNVMLRRLPAVVEYLNRLPLDGLPEPAERLLNMALSLSEVSIAVERYGQPRVVNGRERARFYPESQR
jgi:hypothetical protein